MAIFRRLRIFFRHMKPSVFSGLCLILCIAIFTVGTKLHGDYGKFVKARRILESDDVRVRYGSSNSRNLSLNTANSFIHTPNSPEEVRILRNVEGDKFKINDWKQYVKQTKKKDTYDHGQSLVDNIGHRNNSVFDSFLNTILQSWNLDTEKKKRMVENAFISASSSPFLQLLFSNTNSPASKQILSSLISNSRLEKLVKSDNITKSAILQACQDILRLSEIPNHDTIHGFPGKDTSFERFPVKNSKEKNYLSLSASKINGMQSDTHKNVNSKDKMAVPVSKLGSKVSGRVSKNDQIDRNRKRYKQERQKSFQDALVPSPHPDIETSFTISHVVDGIFWSDDVEDSVPPGISSAEADSWIAKSRISGFKSLQPPDWNRCGRPHNAFAVLMDGTEMCARYRAPFSRLIQGETLSYWLARLLTLDNVPPVSLSAINSSQWDSQRAVFGEVGWKSPNHVALIMWITDMDSRPGHPKLLMPLPILKAYKSGKPLDADTLATYFNTTKGNNKGNRADYKRNTLTSLATIAQWGTMILFDYLTGNYDRVASMQDGADKEKKPSIIEESIRNLKKSKSVEKLWLIDNESGFLDAYSLMYGPDNGQRFIAYHDRMLHTTCIFQRRVVRRLQALQRQEQAHKALEKYARLKEPLYDAVERDHTYELFVEHFSKRLDTVVKWIHYCEQNERLKGYKSK